MALFDIFKNLDVRSTLETLSNTAKTTAGKARDAAPAGTGPLITAGAVGSLLGALMSKSPLQGAVLAGAGAAAVNFYQKWKEQQAAQAARQSVPAPGGQLSGQPSQAGQAPYGYAAPAQQAAPADPTALLLLRAMVYAARADGHMDETERARIRSMTDQMFPGQDVSLLLQEMMNQPLDPAGLAACVVSAEQGADLYRLSCLVLDIDHFMERSYLDALAAALHIDASGQAVLEQEAAAARQSLTPAQPV